MANLQLKKKNTLIKRQQNKIKIQERIDLLNNIETTSSDEKDEIGKEIKKII